VATALARFLDEHPRTLVLTGAGCSTESGIPDYRDEAGEWKHRRPMTFAEFVSSEGARRRYWAGSLAGWPRVRDARPNAAHVALERLEALGRIVRLVTQNVDGLHQKAGSRRVTDLHGRLDLVECLDCGAQVARDDVQQLLLAWNPDFSTANAAPAPDGDARVSLRSDGLRIPACRECGGQLKPAVVFFGENVPRLRVEEALRALAESDALLVVGSSLMVYSGYRFVLAAETLGRPVAILSRGRTRADARPCRRFIGDCGLLGEAAALLEGTRNSRWPTSAPSRRT
jgi:NAD-dependent SIR2 family protein deacetylase